MSEIHSCTPSCTVKTLTPTNSQERFELTFANARSNVAYATNGLDRKTAQTLLFTQRIMELIFDVRKEDDLLVAVCEDPDMATHGRTLEELLKMVKELLLCHFDEGDERRSAKPVLRLHEESAVAYA